MRQRAEWRDRHKMIYDTGAQVTSMSREMCDRLRIDWRRTTNYTMQSVRGVGNTSTPCKVLHDVEFYICIDAPLKITAQRDERVQAVMHELVSVSGKETEHQVEPEPYVENVDAGSSVVA